MSSSAWFPRFWRDDIVVMDNCRIDLRAGVREAIEKAGATLRYLPKYSPDLNPIELAYSKFKTFLRKVAARTVPAPPSSNPLVLPSHSSAVKNVPTIGLRRFLERWNNPSTFQSSGKLAVRIFSLRYSSSRRP